MIIQNFHLRVSEIVLEGSVIDASSVQCACSFLISDSVVQNTA
jgi:hypothetical protein